MAGGGGGGSPREIITARNIATPGATHLIERLEFALKSGGGGGSSISGAGGMKLSSSRGRLPDFYDDEDEVVNCHSVVACIWLLVYKGVPAGELGDVIDGTDNTDDGYLWRILFDLSFFIW